jgi:hypothetical protein
MGGVQPAANGEPLNGKRMHPSKHHWMRRHVTLGGTGLPCLRKHMFDHFDDQLKKQGKERRSCHYEEFARVTYTVINQDGDTRPCMAGLVRFRLSKSSHSYCFHSPMYE